MIASDNDTQLVKDNTIILSNYITLNQAKLIAHTLKNNTSLTSIRINFSRNSIENEIIKIIADGLKYNTSVTSINFSYNEIEDKGAKALANVLKHNRSVTSIDFSYNEIGEEGAKALADGLKHNRSVTSIDLSYNEIEDEAITALAEALKDNTSVTSIGIGDNLIGEEGAKALADVLLKSNKSVTSINFRSNQIREEGAKALAEALKHNTSITSIDLADNQIREEGAKALAEALKHNTSITSIDLGYNQIGEEGAKALADVLKNNKSVTSIGLGYNQIKEEGIAALTEALKYNFTLLDLPNFDKNLNNIQLTFLVQRNHLAKDLKKWEELTGVEKFLFNHYETIESALKQQDQATLQKAIISYREISNKISRFENLCTINGDTIKNILDETSAININKLKFKGVYKNDDTFKKSSFGSLPVELIHEILKYVSFKDIKSVSNSYKREIKVDDSDSPIFSKQIQSLAGSVTNTTGIIDYTQEDLATGEELTDLSITDNIYHQNVSTEVDVTSLGNHFCDDNSC